MFPNSNTLTHPKAGSGYWQNSLPVPKGWQQRAGRKWWHNCSQYGRRRMQAEVFTWELVTERRRTVVVPLPPLRQAADTGTAVPPGM